MNIANHIAKEKNGIILERMRLLPPGGKMADLPEHLQHKSFKREGVKKTGGPNMRLLRLEMNKPSLTVTAYIFYKFVHPIKDRYITPREAACLQDFPLDWEFCGNLGQIHKQIGNAVPVKLAAAIAKEVAKYFRKQNKYKEMIIASYFTGAGGLDLGFETASGDDIQFKTKFSNDIEKSVELTINKNRPNWNFYKEDIRKLSPNIVLHYCGKNPDVIIGGPPCQPFSVAGKQKAIDDPLGVLYRDYIKHIEVLKPSIVIMENVYGLAQIKSINMIAEINKSFKKIGYTVINKELLAADYGTPQMRRRIFFIASKNINYFNFPQPTHCETENLLGLPLYVGAGNILLNLPDPEK
jgi:DNA (cytosine-5)-methyltransferase 1